MVDRQALTLETAGSNPVGSTTYNAECKVDRAAGFSFQCP